MANNIIEFKKISIRYPDKILFNNLNLNISKGSFHYIMGKSGAGKTSLLKLLYTFNVPYEGQIYFFDRALSKISKSEHQKLKQRIGIAFQNFYLLDHLNVLDNLTLPLRINNTCATKARSRGLDLLDFIGLSKEIEHFPHQLSGGQKQRLVVARALITKPDLFLADEPTGNLDDENAVLLMRLFEAINAQGVTVMLATHNKDLVATFPHNKIFIDKGRIFKELPKT